METVEGSFIEDRRFTHALYTIPQAARLVGMTAATLETWTTGFQRRPYERLAGRPGPVVTALPRAAEQRTIPFVGLVEAAVVQAFRQTGLPTQRIRRALGVLADSGEEQHPLASKRFCRDGANVLYDYAKREGDKQLGLLTLTLGSTGSHVFHEVIQQDLTRIEFGDRWATELILPVTARPLLRVKPSVGSGDPIFVHGGAPLTAVRSRALAGEAVASIAADYDVPAEDITEALGALWPQKLAA